MTPTTSSNTPTASASLGVTLPAAPWYAPAAQVFVAGESNNNFPVKLMDLNSYLSFTLSIYLQTPMSFLRKGDTYLASKQNVINMFQQLAESYVQVYPFANYYQPADQLAATYSALLFHILDTIPADPTNTYAAGSIAANLFELVANSNGQYDYSAFPLVVPVVVAPTPGAISGPYLGNTPPAGNAWYLSMFGWLPIPGSPVDKAFLAAGK